ncbi:MAG: YcxB family protein [Candidatus Methylacidiphilales bacterium]
MTFFKPKTRVIIYSFLLALLLLSLVFNLLVGLGEYTGIAFFYFHGLGFVIIFLKLKKAKEQIRNEKSLLHKTPFNDILNITVSGTIEFKRYLKYQLSLLYGNSLLTTFAIVIFIITIFWSTYVAENIDFTIIAVPIIVLIIAPLAWYRSVKKIYQSNKILNEPQQIEINNEYIHIITSHVDSKVKWSNFLKIYENKYFFILFQTEQIGVFVDKSFLTDEQIGTLRSFINSLPIPEKLYK